MIDDDLTSEDYEALRRIALKRMELMDRLRMALEEDDNEAALAIARELVALKREVA